MPYYIQNFIQSKLVTAIIILELRKASVFKNLVSTHTVAELGNGKSFTINGIGDITIQDYDGTDLTFDELSDTSAEVALDQSKAFAFYAEKVDTQLAAVELVQKYAAKGAYKLGDTADTFIATGLTTLATVVNATPQDVDDTNIADVILAIKTKMDEENVPTEGRWMVVPPFISASIAKANIGTPTTLESARTKGYVDDFLGFRIYMSNNLVNGANVVAKPKARFMLAGISECYHFVDGIDEFEMSASEKRFATAVKGLNVYGGKVTQAKAVYKQDVQPA